MRQTRQIGRGSGGDVRELALDRLGRGPACPLSMRHPVRLRLGDLTEMACPEFQQAQPARCDLGVCGSSGRSRRGSRSGLATAILGDRGGRHPGVDDAGHPLHPSGRARRLCRRVPRRGDPRGGVHLLPRPPAWRSRAGASLPARAGRPDQEPRDRSRQGKVFDLALPLDEVAEGYHATDERRAIKVLSSSEGCLR